MINHTQLRKYIIRPTLDDLQLFSEAAEELLIFTTAVETNGGCYIVQKNGPACGIYQCEPNTHFDIWTNYIARRSSLMSILAMKFQAPRIQDASRLIYDLRYASLIARLHYARIPETLPDAKDVDGMWDYYKTFYNTPKGKAEKDPAIKAYQNYIKAK